MVSTNCYVLQNEQTKECLIIDPAASSSELMSYIESEGLAPQAILLTHGHFDHIMGVDTIKKQYDIPVYAGEMERELLEDASKNLSSAYGIFYELKEVNYVVDGQVLELAGFSIQSIYTPGHTIGGCCYYIQERGDLFSGDTLFCNSIGRTGLPTGSMSALVKSIKEKLFTLPDDTIVYPGHMEETTIAYEKENNPFL